MRPVEDRHAAESVTADEVSLEDLRSCLNPVRAADLTELLATKVPAARRPWVALAFADLTPEEWGDKAGIRREYVWRWITARVVQIPFGAALRMSKVLGVPADVLFADWANGQGATQVIVTDVRKRHVARRRRRRDRDEDD